MSVASDGTQGNGVSTGAVISLDGRFVAFASDATNLVVGDTNGVSDVFVHDLQTGATERVSVDSSGAQGNGGSFTPSISSDGRFVAFFSQASNLVTSDTNGRSDIFVHDRSTGTTVRVSVDSAGTQSNNSSFLPSISDDGRFVAFHSPATNLVPDDTNATRDVFVHDRDTDGDGIFDEPGAVSTERVSVDSTGTQGDGLSRDGVISGDGRFVAFPSIASNLVPADGTNIVDVYLHDRTTGTTELVSVDSAGNQSEGDNFSPRPAISADGRFVAFNSFASDLVSGDTNVCPPAVGRCADVFVRDRIAGTTERVSVDSAGTQSDAGSGSSAISDDGRYVAFNSGATNLVSNDTNGASDVFLHDRQTGITIRISVDSGGIQGNGSSRLAFINEDAISGDGRFVAFESAATNLVAGDTNGVTDVFVHDRGEAGTSSQGGAGIGHTDTFTAASTSSPAGWGALGGVLGIFGAVALGLVVRRKGPRVD